MEVTQLLSEARKIWGDDKLTLEQITIRMGVVQGDMSRLTRYLQEGSSLDEKELKKEMGNIIFSMIRWCDDLGFDPQECVELAKQAQEAYMKKRQAGRS